MKKELDLTKKHYYAGYSYMGINYTYDSPCWTAKVFFNKKDRDQWVEENEYNDQGNLVMEAIPSKIAYKIARIKSYNHPGIDDNNNLIAL